MPAKTVALSGNCIKFQWEVVARTHRKFLSCLCDWREGNYDELHLDFSKCRKAFPEGMLPLLATTDALRREGVTVTLTLPQQSTLKNMFINTNWAHIIEPEWHRQTFTEHLRRTAAQRFANSRQQQDLVHKIMNVVLSGKVLHRDLTAGLEWSINEITDNVLNHADCAEGGIVQSGFFGDKFVFGVADSGRGILSSLSEGYKGLTTDKDAISEAIKAGVTRNSEHGQGNGLCGAFQIAVMSKGRFQIMSGLGDVVADDLRLAPTTYTREASEKFSGTFVYAEFGTKTPFEISEALRLRLSDEPYQPTDIIELHYETEEGALKLRLCEEPAGTGTRLAGRSLRMKCRNLLNAEPTKPLVLDWDGINVVPSSFADELVGKLFTLLGPEGFKTRIRNVNMKKFVQDIITKAVQQRAESDQVSSMPIEP